jgi:hypothetical protein
MKLNKLNKLNIIKMNKNIIKINEWKIKINLMRREEIKIRKYFHGG